MDEIAELRDALDRLHSALDDLIVRGLRVAGPQDLARLVALRDEFRAAGAGGLAERLEAAIEAVRADGRSAAAAVLRAMTATRLFDRMLTLEVAGGMLQANELADEVENEDEDEEPGAGDDEEDSE